MHSCIGKPCYYADRICEPNIGEIFIYECSMCPIYDSWLAKQQNETRKKGESLFDYLELDRRLGK